MKDIVLHHKISIIYTIIRLAKDDDFRYVLQDDSAKELTRSLLKELRTFNFSEHNVKGYEDNIEESLKILL